jgi:hypothetical protein
VRQESSRRAQIEANWMMMLLQQRLDADSNEEEPSDCSIFHSQRPLMAYQVQLSQEMRTPLK